MIVGGVNGAGKSTLTGKLVGEQNGPLSKIAVIDPDVLTKAELAAGAASLRSANLGALRQVSKLINRYLAERVTFMSETVLANVSYRDYAIKAKQLGFEVRLFYVGLRTVDDALQRVAERVARGFHSVPDADVRRRWEPSHRNLAWFAQYMDAVEVFSNATYGGPTRLVAEAQVGVVRILDEAELPAVTAALRPLVRI